MLRAALGSRWAVVCGALFVACSNSSTVESPDASGGDAGAPDASGVIDSGSSGSDAGALDSAIPIDAGNDGATSDAALEDAGADTGAAADTGPSDGGDAAPNNADDAAPSDASDAATGPAVLTISDAPAFDYGSVLEGTSADHTFLVANAGALAATTLNASAFSSPFSFKGGTYPGTGGTCATSLPGNNATCSIVVTFAPIATGLASSTLTVGYFDGTTTQSASRPIQGTGLAPATLAISDGPTFDYGAVVMGASATHSFTLTNSGGADATSLTPSALTAPFQFTGGSYPGTGGTCGASLASTASCTVVVDFAPTAAGLATSSLAVTYSDGLPGASVTRAIQGTGIFPALVTISDGATFDYGDDVLNTPNDHTFTLTNGGGAVAASFTAGTLAAAFSFKGGSYPGTGGTCAASLSPSAACTVVVTFTPTALGAASATLSIGYTDGAAAQTATRPIQGTGIAPGLVTISDGATFDYSGVVVGTTLDHTFTFKNTGTATATAFTPGTLAAPFMYKGSAYPGTGGTCATSLAGGNATCTIVVTFSPTSAGLASTTLSLGYSNGAGGQTATRAIQGTGITAAVLSISDGPTYDYLSVVDGTTSDHVFTVSNGGGATASSILPTLLSTPFSFKAGAYPGTGGTCGAALLGSASCTVVVTFAPTVPGLATSVLSLGYFDGANPQTAVRPIQGKGAAPALLAISDAPTFDYGTLVDGTSGDHTFIVTNSGGGTATSFAATPLSAPLSFKGGAYPGTGGTCSVSLAGSGATCSLVVTFAPTSPGLVTGTLSIAYFDGANNQGVVRPIQGTGAAPAVLAISDGPTFDYGSEVDGTSNDHTFTVINVGTATATSVSVSALSAPFSFKGGSYPGAGGSCGASLAGSDATCTIVVTFAPSAPGLATGSLSLGYFDGAQSQGTARAVQGTGVSPALLAISDGPTFNYGSDVDGTTNDHSFTVSNNGSSAATSLSATHLVAPYSFKGSVYPGTGGSCGASLGGSGTTCTIVVTFAPVTPGLASSSLSLAYFDGANAQNVARPFQGTGVAPAVLSISDGATYDYGSQVDGTHNDHPFTITNSGSATATSLSPTALAVPYAFKGGAYPGTGGSCGASLAGGNATCTVVVTFSPTSAGLATATLGIGYFDGANSQSATRPMQGTGVAPAVLTFEEGTAYGFGTIGIGQTSEHVFHVSNTGSSTASSIAPVALVAPFAFKGGLYPGFGGTCGTSLSAGVACTIVADYVAASGPSSESLSLGYNDGAQSQTATVALSGTGTSAALLAFTDLPPYAYSEYGIPPDPATFDFGAHGVASSSDHTFFVTNNGGAGATAIVSLSLSAPFSFKGGTFPGVGGGCGSTLAVSATCTVVVTFAPTTSTSPVLATVSLDYNDGTTTQTASRPVSGEVTSNAVLIVQDYQGVDLGPSYDFGEQGVGTPGTHPFYVTNQGVVTATAMTAGTPSPPFAFAGGSYPGTGGSCAATLAPGSSCVVVGSFSPAVAGPVSGALAVAYNDGASAQTATRAVRGTGITTAFLTISDNQTPSIAYGYGTIPVNQPSDATFMVVNQGAVAATSIAGSALTAPFSYTGGTFPGTGGTCGATLAAGANCTVLVRFQPTLNATSNATLSLGYSDGVKAQTAQRAITGSGTTLAILQITDSSQGNSGGFGAQYQPYDFGTSGIPTDHTFYVTNSGAQAATSMGGGAQTTPTFQMKGGTYPGAGGTCGASLGTGASCTVVVTFTPGASPLSVGTLSVGYNDGSTTQTATRSLVAEATVTALLVIVDQQGETQQNGGPYVYPTTGIPEYHTFYVVNEGEQSATSIADGATLGSGFAFTGGSYPGIGGTCGTSLSTGTSCALSVTFTPTGSASSSSTITLDYFDSSASQTATRAVTGTGSAQALLQVFSQFGGGGGGGGYNFGTWGVTTSQIFDVFNSGAQAATSMGDGHNLGALFSFTGGAYPGTGGTCGATLPSNASCSIAVSFNPSGSGPASSTIGVAYFDGSASQDATLAVSGTSTALALVSVAAGPGGGTSSPPYDYGTSGAPEDHTFTVTNTGAQPAAALSDGGSLGGAFGYKGGSYPGVGGTCGSSLASGGSCLLVVTFTPSGSGPESSMITLNYNNGSSGQKATLGVSGTATTAAILTIADYQGANGGGSSFDFGTWGIPTSHTFYVTNGGAQAATQMGDASELSNGFGFAGSAYPGTGGTCGMSLAMGASCSVVVTFTPSGSGPASSTLGVKYNDGTSGQTAQRQVNGTSAANALVQIFDYPQQQVPYSNPYDYGTVGVPTQNTFYVTNTGAKTATSLADGGTLGNGFGYQGGAYPGSGGTCAATLGSGAVCTIVVTFTPSGNGQASSTLTLAYNDGSSPQTATNALTGTSTTAAVLEFDGQGNGPPNPVDFGTSGVPVSQTFSLVNQGGQTATSMGDGGTLSDMFSFAGGAYPGTGGTCSASLAKGATCTVVVTFTPTGSGPASSTITIAYNNGSAAQTVTRPVSGTATSSAVLVVTPYPGQTQGSTQPFDFGTWGVQTSQTMYLTNSGAKSATSVGDGGTLGSGFGYAGTSGFPGTAGTCTGTIASGATCTIVVAFTPSGNGPVSSTLTIDYNDGTQSQTSTLGLQGTATTAAFLVVDDFNGNNPDGSGQPSYPFGTWGTPSSHTFFVVNNGAQQATAMADGATLGGDFAFPGGYPGTGGNCGTTLASNATCALVVTFTPAGSGARSSTLTISYNDGSKAQTSTNALTGTATTRAYLVVSEFGGGGGCGDSCGPFGFGSVAVNGTLSQTFTVFNDGAVSTTTMGDGGGLAVPFAYAGSSGFPGTAGTCGAVLSAGATCTVIATFKPVATGTFIGDLAISYGDGQGAPLVSGRELTGTGQ